MACVLAEAWARPSSSTFYSSLLEPRALKPTWKGKDSYNHPLTLLSATT